MGIITFSKRCLVYHEMKQEIEMEQMKQQRGDQKIAVHDSWALRYWTRELGVTETELRDTVEAVGPKVDDVKKLLTRQ